MPVDQTTAMAEALSWDTSTQAPIPFEGTSQPYMRALFDTVLGPLSPAVSRALALPTAALLHALLAVADVASRVPFAVDARGVAAIIAGAALVAAACLAPRLR